MDPINKIRIPIRIWEKMKMEAEQNPGEEICGLVAGKSGEVRKIFPVENVLHSPVRYRMDPSEQIEKMILIEKKGWDLTGIYHSHPNGPSFPSETDIREAGYPDSAYLIWSRDQSAWICRGFKITGWKVVEIDLEVI